MRDSKSGSRQLTLELPYEAALGRDDYLVGSSNKVAFECLETWPKWPAPVVLLAGPVGSGKSHLVNIWREKSNAKVVEASHLTADAVESLVESSPVAVAVENAHVQFDETALFHLFNRIQQCDGHMLITSRSWPSGWNLKLPDLESRLRMATPLEVREPDDDLLSRLLVKLFSDRQILVDAAVIDYLVVRMERSLAAAAGIVDGLDRQAMAEGGKITRKLAASVLRKIETNS